MISDRQDAMGHQMYDFLHGKESFEVVEREDGYIDFSLGARLYFAPYKIWPRYEKTAMRFARGRVLDIGCGAGRCLVHLKSRGHEVFGIDNSPLAIKTCRERGLKDVKVMPATQVDRKLGVFDTIVMYGNNFGLMANRKRARWLLGRFYNLTSAKGRIIASTTNIYETNMPEHLQYQKYNRQRGRMSGQIRIRIRYKKYCSPFFDYLMVSPAELKDLVKGTGWQIERIIESGAAPYCAILCKTS